MLELYTKLRNEYGIMLEKIDMGGGISGNMNDEFSKQFLAVRAYPTLSRRGLKQIFFEERNLSYIEKDPPIQMCIWRNYKLFITDPFVVVGNYPYQRRWISINR